MTDVHLLAIFVFTAYAYTMIVNFVQVSATLATHFKLDVGMCTVYKVQMMVHIYISAYQAQKTKLIYLDKIKYLSTVTSKTMGKATFPSFK